jgi:alpha-L-fucosidase
LTVDGLSKQQGFAGSTWAIGMGAYEPTADSLSTHAVPDWYHDAKLGIFIHWGPYSVPAYADPEGDHAYAEWYPYYMYREGSDTHAHHRSEYGEDVEYLDFARQWRAEQWDPEEWADFFAEVGAGYVVLTGEHHDGFPLWPSHYTKYNAGELGPERDLVGDLCEAVRDRGLRFAASYHANLNYYQPGFDGAFGHPAYEGTAAFDDTDPQPEYVDFMNAKHRELIRRYDSDLLWFDTPQADDDRLRANELIAEFYNRAAERGTEVLVNDRGATDAHGDIDTPEYETYDEIQEAKWETCRGIGNSFGYNAEEGPEDHLSATDLVHLFVDVVSKNGNLLINVGPRADGTIPDLQREPLAGLGDWLDTNGQAIFGTRYWAVAEAAAPDVEVRYTWADDTLYAIALGWPGESITLDIAQHVDATPDAARLLGSGDVNFESTRAGVRIDLPASPPAEAPAYAFALDGVPRGR